jgi:hypothetical protein
MEQQSQQHGSMAAKLRGLLNVYLLKNCNDMFSQ